MYILEVNMKYSTKGKLYGFLSGFVNASHDKRVILGTWETHIVPFSKGMICQNKTRQSKDDMGVRSFHSTLSVGKLRTWGRERRYIVTFKGNISSLDRLIN